MLHQCYSQALLKHFKSVSSFAYKPEGQHENHRKAAAAAAPTSYLCFCSVCLWLPGINGGGKWWWWWWWGQVRIRKRRVFVFWLQKLFSPFFFISLSSSQVDALFIRWNIHHWFYFFPTRWLWSGQLATRYSLSLWAADLQQGFKTQPRRED